MSKQKGIVRRVEDDRAWVMARRMSAGGDSCGDCGNRGGCHMVEGMDRIVVKAKNIARARIGDEVELSLSSKAKMKSMFVLYQLSAMGYA